VFLDSNQKFPPFKILNAKHVIRHIVIHLKNMCLNVYKVTNGICCCFYKLQVVFLQVTSCIRSENLFSQVLETRKIWGKRFPVVALADLVTVCQVCALEKTLGVMQWKLHFIYHHLWLQVRLKEKINVSTSFLFSAHWTQETQVAVVYL
jgi:hypothetical protein